MTISSIGELVSSFHVLECEANTLYFKIYQDVAVKFLPVAIGLSQIKFITAVIVAALNLHPCVYPLLCWTKLHILKSLPPSRQNKGPLNKTRTPHPYLYPYRFTACTRLPSSLLYVSSATMPSPVPQRPAQPIQTRDNSHIDPSSPNCHALSSHIPQSPL